MRTIYFTTLIALLVLSMLSCDTSKRQPSSNTSTGNTAVNEGSGIVEKYWKLIEIEGKKMVPSDDWRKEPHFVLNANEKRVNGSTGCNSFFGSYELSNGNRIKFSGMGATKMACRDMELERQLFEVLELADNYTINNDTLFLNKARRAPLARFVAVYMK